MECCIFVLFGIGIAFVVWIYVRKSQNFPPGPIGLPIVGYFPFLDKYPYKTFMKLGQKYGNIFSVPLGHQRVVVLNDWPTIKEAFVNQAETFNGRVKVKVLEDMLHYSDIIFSDGPGWRERKRFTLHHLRNFGVGKSTMEDVIVEEFHKIFHDLIADADKMVDVNGYFFFAFLNIIWTIVSGKRFDRNSKMLLEFTGIMIPIFREASNTNPLFFMPYLRYIFAKDYKLFINENNRLDYFIRQDIDEHEKTHHDGAARDMIDVYLDELYKKERNVDKSLSLTKENITQMCKNLLTAGIDTSNNTLLWGLLYMAMWPSIQQKVQEELDVVVGRERLPSCADSSRLQYTNAVILEIFRYSSIGPLSISHTTLAECHLAGYTLPKGTIVIPNLWAVHHDPKYWSEPDVFHPERFVNQEGQLEKPEYLIPFSVGGRTCPGKSLAKMSSFLFLTCILHRFAVTLPVGIKPPSLNPVYSLTLSPKPVSLIFNRR